MQARTTHNRKYSFFCLYLFFLPQHKIKQKRIQLMNIGSKDKTQKAIVYYIKLLDQYQAITTSIAILAHQLTSNSVSDNTETCPPETKKRIATTRFDKPIAKRKPPTADTLLGEILSTYTPNHVFSTSPPEVCSIRYLTCSYS
jgi:hypothetical protein